MNYKRHYNLLIAFARTRTLSTEIKFHVHHILPRCLSGTNDKSNLVALTYREHYVAHRLLAKMHPSHTGLAYACTLMLQYSTIKNGRIYENVINNLNLSHTAEARQKIGDAHRGMKHTTEAKQKMSESLKGRKSYVRTEETKQKQSKAAKGRVFTEEHKRKLSEAAQGRTSPKKGKPGHKHTEETKRKMRETRRRLKAPKLADGQDS